MEINRITDKSESEIIEVVISESDDNTIAIKLNHSGNYVYIDIVKGTLWLRNFPENVSVICDSLRLINIEFVGIEFKNMIKLCIISN